MRIKQRILFLALILIIIQILMVGCERRDLVDIPTSSLYIKVNWDEETKAKTQFFYVAIYPQDPKEDVITSFIESDGGYVNVPRGKFDILIYTYDYEMIMVRITDKFSTSYATTSPARLNSFKMLHAQSGAKIINETDSIFYTGTYQGLEIEYVDQQYMVEITPKNIIKHFEIRIGINNTEYVSDINSFVDGLAGSYLLGRKEIGQDTVSIRTRLRLKGDFLVLNFNTFGLASNAYHHLIIDAILVDNQNKSYSYDITKEMKRIPNGGLIVLDSIIEIPKVEGVGGGGIGATVGGWGDEDDVDIIM